MEPQANPIQAEHAATTVEVARFRRAFLVNVLTVAIRRLIPGPVPLFVIDAPRGSGKSGACLIPQRGEADAMNGAAERATWAAARPAARKPSDADHDPGVIGLRNALAAGGTPPPDGGATEPRVMGCWFRVTGFTSGKSIWLNAKGLHAIYESELDPVETCVETNATYWVRESVREVMELVWKTQDLGAGDAAGMTTGVPNEQ